jgi:hypothetical protein
MKKLFNTFLFVVAITIVVSFCSCGERLSPFSFELVSTQKFSKDIKIFPSYNRIYVLDGEKLVCLDSNNCEMIGTLKLPGTPTDSHFFEYSDTELAFVFSTKEGFVYKEYGFLEKDPYVEEKRSFKILGSKIECFVKDYAVISNQDRNLFLYNYKDFRLLDSMKMNSDYWLSTNWDDLVLFDGKRVKLVSVDKGKFTLPTVTEDEKGQYMGYS